MSGSVRRTLAPHGSLRSFSKWLVIGLVVLLAVGVAGIAPRILFYRQSEDREHLENKRRGWL